MSCERYLTDPDLEVWLGNAAECLRELPDASAQMCVTSPPFYGLRDYGTGTWEGGDPGCDHRKGNLVSAKSSLRGRDGPYEGEKKLSTGMPMGAVCGKCGATRVGDEQIGLEPTVGDWVHSLVQVFREVRRVLRPDGTLWLELGDSFSSSGGERTYGSSAGQVGRADAPAGRVAETKPKDLLGAPFEVAFALRADGWYWRQTIIWHKPNAMPESASDRPTTGHSYVFLLTPSARYFYDGDAIAEPAEWARWGDQDAGKYDETGKGQLVKPLTREQIAKRFGGGRQRGSGRGGYKTTDERNERFQGTLVDIEPEPTEQLAGSWHDHSADLERGNGKQRTADGTPAGTVRGDGWDEIVAAGDALKRARSVWTIPTEPNRLAVCPVCEAYWQGDHPDEHCGVEVVEHFAAFARQLVRRTILAGTSERGACAECGSPWAREVESERLRPAAPSGNRELGRWDQDTDASSLRRQAFCPHGRLEADMSMLRQPSRALHRARPVRRLRHHRCRRT